MPTVPTSFVPQAGLEAGGMVPYQAAPVQPVENYAARQQMDIGKGLTEIGGVAFRSGAALQDSLDEARSKEIETNFLQSVTTMMHGQGGYMTTSGKDAEERYGSTSSGLADAAQAALGAAQNETQRQMLAPVLARHTMSFGAQAGDHREKEVSVYYANESKTRANQFVGLAVNAYRSRNTVDKDGHGAGAFHENMVVALDEIHKYGAAAGLAEDSAQMKALERAVYTQATAGVASRLVTDKSYHAALEYVNRQIEAGLIEQDTADKLLAGITADRDRQMVGELTDSIRSEGVLDTPSGTDNMILPVKGKSLVRPGVPSDAIGDGPSVTIGAEPGTPIVAPADGRVLDRWKNAEGKNMISIAVGDKRIITLEDYADTILHGNVTHVGKGEVIGMVGKSGETNYAVTVDGKPIDPLAANALVQVDRKTATRPKTLKEAIAVADKIPDADLRRAVQANLRSQYAQDEAIAKQEYGANLDNVMDFLADENNTIDMIPFAQWSAIKPTDQAQLMRGQRQQNDLTAAEEIARDPSIVTKDWLESNRFKLTRGTYIKLLEEVNKPEALKDHDVTLDADQVNKTLLEAGMDSMVHPASDEDKDDSLRFRENVKVMIDAEQRRQNRKLSVAEKQQIIDAQVTRKVTVGAGWFSSGTKKAVTSQSATAILNGYETNDEGKTSKLISDERRAEIEELLRDNGIPVNPQSIVRLWIQAGMSK